MEQHSFRDNPFWPFASAVEKAKDIAIGLPLPNVSEAKWTLTRSDIKCIVIGAGIMASGGGGNIEHGKSRAEKVMESKDDQGNNRLIQVVNPCRLDADKMGLVCSVALMGDPMAERKEDEDEGSLLAIRRLQQVTIRKNKLQVDKTMAEPEGGKPFAAYVASLEDLKDEKDEKDEKDVPLSKKITGLTAVETGGLNTIEPLCASAQNGLPSLDVAGLGRSIPTLPMYMPFIYDCNFCPAALADKKKKSVICVGVDSCEKLEQFFRHILHTSMKDISSIAMGLMPFETIFSRMALFATSRAWQLGRAVQRALNVKDDKDTMESRLINAIIERQQGILLIKGRVMHVESASKGGFVEGYFSIKGLYEYNKHFVKVCFKNENFVVKRTNANGKEEGVLATIPDVISVINLTPEDGLDVTVMAGKRIILSKMVAVVILPANPMLYTPKALKVVGPRAFGLDMDYKEPQILIKPQLKS